MTSRTISKVLITQEDLALGQGTTSQTRQGVSTQVTKVDLPWIVTTIIEVQRLDTSKYKHCIIDLSGQLRFYRYETSSTATVDNYSYIAPNSGLGQWVLVHTNNKYSVKDYTELDALPSQLYEDGKEVTVTNNGISGIWAARTGAHTANVGIIRTMGDNAGRYWERLRTTNEIYSSWFGGTDPSHVQAALNYARTTVILAGSTIANQTTYGEHGGATVIMPNGLLDWSGQTTSVEIPETVSLIGAGKASTLIYSDFDGQILRNKVTSGNGVYNKTGIRIANFGIRGIRTATSQIGLDTLRLFDCLIENIEIFQCGGEGGLKLRQALVTTVKGCVFGFTAGNGITIDGGIQFWATPTSSGLPSNVNMITDCHGFSNDGAGLKIQGLANGNIISGGSYETNYASSGNNAGYNIHVTATTFSENLIDSVWTEGPVQAHIYMNGDSSSSSLKIENWKHFGAGTSGSVDRALIVDKGVVNVERAFGHATSYKTISGSNKPFRLNVAGGVAVLRVVDCDGSTISDFNFVEDETGADAPAARQTWFNKPISGVDFTHTLAQTGSKTLDNYQRATDWTPTYTTDGTDFDNVTYDSLTEGSYVEIGELVFFSGALRTDSITVGSASGNIVIDGFPSTIGKVMAFTIGTSQAFADDHPESGYGVASTTSMYLTYRTIANGATSLLQVADLATGANANLIRFSGFYIKA